MELHIKVNEDWVPFESINIKEYNYLETDFLFTVDHKMKVSGQFRIDYTDVYIENVEAAEKQKGYGKMLIEFLKKQNQVERITGQSTKEAYNFWEKMKAVLNHQTFKEEGVYSFHIQCRP